MSNKVKHEAKFYVYIVKCSDGTYYTGSTNNLNNRVEVHNKGHGAKYLRGKLPVKLVYTKEYKNYNNALRAEIAIKKLSHKQKEQLVNGHDK